MNRSKAILAITAVMVVLWSNTALGSNGDPVRAGQTTTATARTTLSTNQANGEGLKVALSGATAGAAIRGQNGAKGNGVSGFASNADAYGVSGTNTAGAHGAGAGGFFNGKNNDGVVGTTDDPDSAGVEGRTTGFGNGVEGRSANGNGLFGSTASGSHSGVYGENTGSGGTGVSGTAGNSGIGVYGANTGNGVAGLFDGKVRVFGDLDVDDELNCSGCIDPVDVTGFIRGQAIAMSPGQTQFFGPPLAAFIQLSYQCPANLANNGTLHIINSSGSLANVFVDNGGSNPSYFQMNAGDEITFPASATADSFHIQAQGALGVMTIEVGTVHRASDCHVQTQGVLS